MPLTPPHLDVGGIDVACVVLFGGDKLHPVFLVRDHLSDPAALGVFWQSGGAEDAIGLLVWDLLILCEHHSLFQLLLQSSELQEKGGISSPNSHRAIRLSALPVRAFLRCRIGGSLATALTITHTTRLVSLL